MGVLYYLDNILSFFFKENNEQIYKNENGNKMLPGNCCYRCVGTGIIHHIPLEYQWFTHRQYNSCSPCFYEICPSCQGKGYFGNHEELNIEKGRVNNSSARSPHGVT